MRLRTSACAILLMAVKCVGGTFAVLGTEGGAWPDVLSSVGHVACTVSSADIVVARAGAAASEEMRQRVEAGGALILESASPLAESFGFKARRETVSVIHVVDEHNPTLPIVWGAPAELARFDVPEGSRVFAKDRWTGVPLIAGYRVGGGAVLWVATDPGPNGYERFPYVMQALTDLGVKPGVRASRLWAFFDSSYRLRADVDYLAKRWREAGISALHVASWHFFEPDRERDEYLARLIEACHRHGILVYAWVELPHVSERFWDEHPEWREKTGLLQDAQLDWRKLMNLENRDCAEAVRAGLRREMERFDWDGVNLAELYFESLEGTGNQARFTPMNPDVRERFKAESGWDPVEIWREHKDAKSVRQFLDFRAELARQMQEEWLGVVESYRAFHPELDVVLTHVDDRFDEGVKDAIGADAARVLPLLDSHAFSFLIEDPATVWNLGPRRYAEIAKRYRALTKHAEKLAIDAVLRIGVPLAHKALFAASLGPLFASGKLRAVWHHSQEIAAIAYQLAAQCGCHPHEAWLAGLLHDIGLLIFASRSAAECSREEAWRRAGFPRAYAETLVWGVDHAAAGADLLAQWNVPSDLVEAVRHHGAPELSNSPLAALLYIANVIDRDPNEPEPLASRFRLATALSLTNLPASVLESISRESPIFAIAC